MASSVKHFGLIRLGKNDSTYRGIINTTYAGINHKIACFGEFPPFSGNLSLYAPFKRRSGSPVHNSNRGRPPGRQRRLQMSNAKIRLVGIALVASLLAAPSVETANAAPLSVAGPSIVQPESQVDQVKYRAVRRKVVRHRGRRGVGPGAVLGVFGAVVGAAIANSRRNDDYYYDRGYGPGYVVAPEPDYYYDQPGYYNQPRPYYAPRAAAPREYRRGGYGGQPAYRAPAPGGFNGRQGGIAQPGPAAQPFRGGAPAGRPAAGPARAPQAAPGLQAAPAPRG
jgi:hypothetical protein